MATFTIDQNDPERIHGINSNFLEVTATPANSGWMVITRYIGLSGVSAGYQVPDRPAAFHLLCDHLSND